MGGTLDTRYIAANVTTPAGTTAAAPLHSAVNLGDVTLLSAHLRIPAGHEGQTGWRLDYSGVTIVPYSTPSLFIIGDDDRLDFTVDYEVGNTLQVVTYNVDYYDHTHYLVLAVRDLPDQVASSPAKLTIVTP